MKFKKIINNILEKEMSRKKFIALLGTTVFSLAFLSRGALADVWLRNTDEVKINMNEVRGITNGTITRTAGLITSIAIDGRTVTVNRDVNDVLTGWEDSDYEWTVSRDVDDNIDEWEVTKK